ncbi:MAG: hypothetical protein BWY09_02256 [Candidatus Hydrogenedentes bacterium ADurb.Bin179]|nr:MAG: hypothetical protein BWY09_02256 [Candidatus Hydrogenedentes bacterium ADurb.Bin179]
MGIVFLLRQHQQHTGLRHCERSEAISFAASFMRAEMLALCCRENIYYYTNINTIKTHVNAGLQ